MEATNHQHKEQTVEKEYKLPAELTEEENENLEKKAEELAKGIPGCSKVNIFVSIDKESKKRHVAFLREPPYRTKILISDKAATIGLYSAADELRDSCLLKEHSDILFYGETLECDKYKLGLCDFCVGLVRRVVNAFKKNSTNSE